MDGVFQYGTDLFYFQVNRKKLVTSMWWVFFNTVIVAYLYNSAIYPVVVRPRGCSFERELPGLLTVLLHAAVFIVAEESAFYYSHR